jgi:hypothetical protein
MVEVAGHKIGASKLNGSADRVPIPRALSILHGKPS